MGFNRINKKRKKMTEFEDEVIRLLKEILKKLNENKSI